MCYQWRAASVWNLMSNHCVNILISQSGKHKWNKTPHPWFICGTVVTWGVSFWTNLCVQVQAPTSHAQVYSLESCLVKNDDFIFCVNTEGRHHFISPLLCDLFIEVWKRRGGCFLSVSGHCLRVAEHLNPGGQSCRRRRQKRTPVDTKAGYLENL